MDAPWPMPLDEAPGRAAVSCRPFGSVGRTGLARGGVSAGSVAGSARGRGAEVVAICGMARTCSIHVGVSALAAGSAAASCGRETPASVGLGALATPAAFSVGIGVVHPSSLAFDALLVPAVVGGLFAGRWLIHRIPQKTFDVLMLAFAAVASIRLIL